jgi:hypothetical protein
MRALPSKFFRHSRESGNPASLLLTFQKPEPKTLDPRLRGDDEQKQGGSCPCSSGAFVHQMRLELEQLLQLLREPIHRV